MKIGIDIRCLMNGRYSGVGWYAFNLLRNLFKLDRQNEYVLFYNSGKPVELPVWDYPNVKFCGFHYPNKLFNLSLNFFSRPYLDKLIGGADIFFSPNLHFSSVSSAGRSLVVVHDLSFLAYPRFFTLKQQLWHQLILKKNILSRAEMIVTDSQSTKQDLINLLGIKPEKIQVVYLGVSEKYQAEIDTEELARVREKYQLPEKFFLSIGTIEPRKNLSSAIKALQRLGWPADLVVIGEEGWKCRPVKKLMAGQENIHQLGYLDEGDKPAVYGLAIGLLYPSYYEGFGLPILEAMASGCPVIAGNNSSQGEVLEDCGLLVDPYNLAEISTAIELLMTDGSLRNKLIGQGKARAKEFNWARTAREILNIFNQVI